MGVGGWQMSQRLRWFKSVRVCLFSEAAGFLSVSHLVQMDAGVDGSFGLVAPDIGLHSLLTHAHGGKHLSNLLQHSGGEWQRRGC